MSMAGQLLLIRNREYIFYWFNIFCVLSVYCLVKKCKDRTRNRGDAYKVVGKGYNDREPQH